MQPPEVWFAVGTRPTVRALQEKFNGWGTGLGKAQVDGGRKESSGWVETA
jgi:hypothetical protein